MAHTPSPASPVVSGEDRGLRDRSSKIADHPARPPGAATKLPIRSNKSRSPSLPSLIMRSKSSGSNPNAPCSPTGPPWSSSELSAQCAPSRHHLPRTAAQVLPSRGRRRWVDRNRHRDEREAQVHRQRRQGRRLGQGGGWGARGLGGGGRRG